MNESTAASSHHARLLRLHAVMALVGLGRSTIYDMIKLNAFPAQLKLGRRAVAWRETDIVNWISTRPGMVANEPELVTLDGKY